MSCFIVNLLDTKTGIRASYPFVAAWTKHMELGWQNGDFSSDQARHYYFGLAIGLPAVTAFQVALKQPPGRGRYVVESVQVKGMVVYSEAVA